MAACWGCDRRVRVATPCGLRRGRRLPVGSTILARAPRRVCPDGRTSASVRAWANLPAHSRYVLDDDLRHYAGHRDCSGPRNDSNELEPVLESRATRLGSE